MTRARPALATASLVMGLLVVGPVPAHPQAATASLEVAVRGLTPERPRLRLLAPGVEREQEADGEGRAVFRHLRPGLYRVVARTGERTCHEREVSVGRGQDVALDLDCGPGEAAETPPQDHSPERASRFSRADLDALPRAADPWSVLRDVPGVVVDRVDVGGSETAQQSLVVSHGDLGPGVTWTLDGVDVTDPAALGFTSLYPDMDALEAFEARTGALDVRVRTPGVQVGLSLREPGDRFAGALDVRVRTPGVQVGLSLREPGDRFTAALHLRGSGAFLQSDNLPPALQGRPFLRNSTDRILEMGAEAGGPVRAGRLWLFGAVNRNRLRQDTFTEHAESLRTTSFTAKARLRLGAGTLNLLALRAEKVHEDRDTGFSSSPEARWKQTGPTHLVALEDERRWGGVSLVSRVSYMASGFRLDPQGGMQANAFEDFQGVFQGSYYRFETDRPRLQAGVEAAARRRLLGRDHDLVVGACYRRSPVETFQAWPGDKVVGLERQSVFFRTFHLTGFAIPYRDLSARSVQDELEAYAQDTVRFGRLTVTAGLRLDRLTGHDRPSSVGANPVFPDLLPPVSYAGGEPRFRWLDLLPRVGLAWQASGGLVARLRYAAYGAPLGAGDVIFDNPIGRDFASLTYYWIDRNHDHVAQRDELDMRRGQVGAAGLDPADPGSTLSPNAIDPDLRSPRTHELAASMERSFGRGLQVGLEASLRRLVHPLWRPLRGLHLSDYVVRGGVAGSLFGQAYNVGYYAPVSISRVVPGNGRLLTNREGYSVDSLTVELGARGRAGARFDWRAWGAVSDARERFRDSELAVQDPTPLDTDPNQDRGRIAARGAGLGRSDVFVNARWTAGASLLGHLPAGLEASLLLHARDGFPIPYFQVANSGDPTAGAKNVLVAPHLDRYRLPALVVLDARLARGFGLGRGTLTASLDVFNLLDRSTALQVVRDIELPAFNRAREILRPRILRLGLAYRF